MSKTTNKERLPKFEKALEELEDIVEKMENGDLSLDSALKMFEKGVSISRQCQKVLQEAEQKVQILTQSEDKEPKLLDIENDTD